MANFSESNLQKGMVNVTKALMHKGEFRMPDTAVISSAINAIAVNPLTGALRTREDRSVSTYMPVKAAASTATERTHNGSFARNTSIETAVAWNSHVSGFSISDKQLDNNSFSYEDAFQTGFLGAAQDVMAKAETKFIASLVAAKSQVNAGGINGTFIPATHTMDIALAQKDLFFHNLHTNLKVNKYRGTPTVIVDSLASITAGHQANQGTGNSTNLGYQYMGMNIVTTTNALITGGAANIGTAVAFE
ncbi:MAG: hypothetical protein GY951_13585, partial [Psychromonas sp.]|nr:hypothetical protein [Psychromonas sp.]